MKYDLDAFSEEDAMIEDLQKSLKLLVRVKREKCGRKLDSFNKRVKKRFMLK